MAPPDEDSPRFIAYQVAELVKHVDKFEAQVFARFDALEGRIGNLEFLRKDVYIEAHTALQEKVDSTRTIAMWALGMTITLGALIVSLAAILKLVAG
jgi:hypothetical protein